MIYAKLTHIDHDTTSEGMHSGAVWVFGTCGGSFSSRPRFLYDTVRGCTSQPSKGCKGCVIGGSVTMMRETCGSSVTIPLSPDERARGRGQLDLDTVRRVLTSLKVPTRSVGDIGASRMQQLCAGEGSAGLVDWRWCKPVRCRSSVVRTVVGTMGEVLQTVFVSASRQFVS